jgi:hypothetical protein
MLFYGIKQLTMSRVQEPVLEWHSGIQKKDEKGDVLFMKYKLAVTAQFRS